MATTETRSDAQIEDVIAGVDAGHRMASHEPTEETQENGRRILRGDISADDAVSEAIARHQAAAHRS
ncbi:MAG: antitoxin VbhA family protein [Kineosporiaceae bacterium]|nr:antitoxin VbhA family protein [Aeromicrobium sp.]